MLITLILNKLQLQAYLQFRSDAQIAYLIEQGLADAVVTEGFALITI